jgi:molybdenum cofactor cytidylyltransferase
MREVGIILLAAGESSRLGQPKQLLPFQGRSLILRAATTALASMCRPVVVVLGANSDRIRSELNHLPVTLVHNPNWQLGLGSSIKAGLEAMSKIGASNATKTDGVLLMVSDQPFITSDFLNKLVQSFSIHGGIVASSYTHTLGVPAIFGKEFHQELLSLSPAQGAKCLIEKNAQRVHTVNCPEAGIDIDTSEDYERLLREFNTP